jgi:ribosomal protein S18 acetylase RimI-like enzyme
MGAGAVVERLKSPVAVRLAQSRDQAVLAGLDVVLTADRIAIVGEVNGAVVGAIGIDARPFESECLSRRVASVGALAISPGADAKLAELIAGALELLRESGVSLVSCRRPDTDVAELAALKDAGFREVERLKTLSRRLVDAVETPEGVSLATLDDAEACAAVAHEAFLYDRFHADPDVDNGAADRLKAQWALNSVRGRADAVFVVRDNGKVAGFNACMRASDAAVIDLICVAASYRRRGYARALTLAALAHYTGKVKEMKVGTQSTNIASLALYRAMGFRESSTSITVHAHLS